MRLTFSSPQKFWLSIFLCFQLRREPRILPTVLSVRTIPVQKLHGPWQLLRSQDILAMPRFARSHLPVPKKLQPPPSRPTTDRNMRPWPVPQFWFVKCHSCECPSDHFFPPVWGLLQNRN